jgi:hypothetical protein
VGGSEDCLMISTVLHTYMSPLTNEYCRSVYHQRDQVQQRWLLHRLHRHQPAPQGEHNKCHQGKFPCCTLLSQDPTQRCLITSTTWRKGCRRTPVIRCNGAIGCQMANKGPFINKSSCYCSRGIQNAMIWLLTKR